MPTADKSKQTNTDPLQFKKERQVGIKNVLNIDNNLLGVLKFGLKLNYFD